MIKIKEFVFNPFMENTYVVYDEETGACIIVDPGCYETEEKDSLITFIKAQELDVVKLVNTHCHIDHVLGNQFVKDAFHVPLAIHALDEPVLKAVEAYAPNYGFNRYQEAEVDEYLEAGDFLTFGQSKFEVSFVPGHAPGHIALFNREENCCLGGDVLFRGSIGRTDLPGGDFDTLISSIHEKIFSLGDKMVVYPGHGPATTVGEEKRTNPFCAIAAS